MQHLWLFIELRGRQLPERNMRMRTVVGLFVQRKQYAQAVSRLLRCLLRWMLLRLGREAALLLQRSVRKL